MKRTILRCCCFGPFVLAVCLVLGNAGCAEGPYTPEPSADQSIVLEDDRGVEVTLKGEPQRIAAMTSFAVEILMAMDKAPVARFPDPDLYPPQAASIPEVNKQGRGTTHRLDIEQLIGAGPDLTILHSVYTGVADNVQQSVNAPVLVLNIKSVEDLRDKYDLFGQLAGNPEAADRLKSELDQALADLAAAAPADKPKALSLLGMGQGEWYAHRANHFMGSLLDAVGAQNIAAGDEAHGKYRSLSPIDLEQVILKDPDVIFLVPYGDANFDQVVEGFKSHPATKSLRAVRDGRVHVLPDTIYTSQPGPRTSEALRSLYGYLHPGQSLSVEAPAP